jgi:hypothetical protein
MTLSASQSRSNSDGTSRPCHLAGPQPTWATMPGVAPFRSLVRETYVIRSRAISYGALRAVGTGIEID